MGILECASGASVVKGYHYCKQKRVLEFEEVGYDQYFATVKGSGDQRYSVFLDSDHPRKSKCTCPRADGKRVICKHIVALYFTVHPLEADKFYADAVAYREAEERRQEELQDRLIEYVRKMKKAELQEALLQTLFSGPEWQYDNFIRDNGIDND